MHSVCYANPTRLPRRPISELAHLQKPKRRVGLLIPARTQQLHHESLLKGITQHSYRSWQPPLANEFPLPSIGFLRAAWNVLGSYDVVHAWGHFYPSTVILLFLSLFRKTKVVLTIDALPGYSFSAGSLLDTLFTVWTWTLGRIVYHAPATITLYGKALLPAARRSGIPRGKIRVLGTGIVPHNVPDHKQARRLLEKEFGKGPFIVYAGLLNARKRVTDVLRVAHRLPDYRFLIAGDGPDRERLERDAPPNTHVLGWRNDILTLLAGADCLLFPSSGEGLAGVIMESLLCGTPVVTTRIPCTTDIIQHGREGWLCTVGAIRCFVTGINTVRTNTFREQAARRGRELGWEKVLPDYDRLYG